MKISEEYPQIPPIHTETRNIKKQNSLIESKRKILQTEILLTLTL